MNNRRSAPGAPDATVKRMSPALPLTFTTPPPQPTPKEMVATTIPLGLPTWSDRNRSICLTGGNPGP